MAIFSINKSLALKAIFFICASHAAVECTQNKEEIFSNLMPYDIWAPSDCYYFAADDSVDVIKRYFKDFERLAETEAWAEIIDRGSAALDAALKLNRPHDAAKICAQLTSTAFYLGDYPLALVYANGCHELSENFRDPCLFIRALYLESAVYRALAGKSDEESDRQATFLRAVEIAEEAARLFSINDVNDSNLQGKVYFNLGAAHADNPRGDLDQAAECYYNALDCFATIGATDDVIRTCIRLGKVHLLQKNYGLSQKMIDATRPLITSERLAMHADYLEAQLKLKLNDIQAARAIANEGLARAKALGAKEDELRLSSLLDEIK